MIGQGIAVLVLSAVIATACATTGGGGAGTPVAITSPQQLAGQWNGYLSGQRITTTAVTVIRPDGTYTANPRTPQLPAVDGVITVADGKARYRSSPGPMATQVTQAGTLELYQKGGKRVLAGRSDDGNVKFELWQD